MKHPLVEYAVTCGFDVSAIQPVLLKFAQIKGQRDPTKLGLEHAFDFLPYLSKTLSAPGEGASTRLGEGLP